jgi:PmbA protein
MNTNEKYELANLVMEHALKAGAQQVAVRIYESRRNNIEMRDQNIDSLKESNQSGLSIDLYVDKKYSSNSTNRLKKDDLFKFIDEAVIATRFLAEDEFRQLPDPSLYYKGEQKDLGLFDPGMDGVEARAKIDLATAALNEAYKKDERIISVSSNYNDGISTDVMVTSNGFKGNSAYTWVGLSVSVSLKTETGRPSDYWYENAIFMDKLPKSDIGKKAMERAIQKINPRKIASGKYTVIIENRVAGNLLYPVFSALNGSSIYQKQSFLAGKAGQKIASELLTIVDDPSIPSAPGSRLYDEEGLAAVKRPVIEKGVLKGYYIDNYYGRKLGMQPTSGSNGNIVFETGSRNQQEMMSTLKKGILITGFIGGNCNGSTGDFSYGIEGYLIENGKIVQPVNEMNISGNMSQFWFNLTELGNDIRENDPFRIPSIMLKDVDLSGI